MEFFIKCASRDLGRVDRGKQKQRIKNGKRARIMGVCLALLCASLLAGCANAPQQEIRNHPETQTTEETTAPSILLNMENYDYYLTVERTSISSGMRSYPRFTFHGAYFGIYQDVIITCTITDNSSYNSSKPSTTEKQIKLNAAGYGIISGELGKGFEITDVSGRIIPY